MKTATRRESVNHSLQSAVVARCGAVWCGVVRRRVASRVACGVWRVACGVWRVACGVWRVACDV